MAAQADNPSAITAPARGTRPTIAAAPTPPSSAIAKQGSNMNRIGSRIEQQVCCVCLIECCGHDQRRHGMRCGALIDVTKSHARFEGTPACVWICTVTKQQPDDRRPIGLDVGSDLGVRVAGDAEHADTRRARALERLQVGRGIPQGRVRTLDRARDHLTRRQIEMGALVAGEMLPFEHLHHRLQRLAGDQLPGHAMP